MAIIQISLFIFYSSFHPEIGWFKALLFPTLCQLCCWLMLTDLSYYVLTQRIRSLRLYLSDESDLQEQIVESGSVISLLSPATNK